MEILWKGTVSAGFRAIRPKLYGHCAFPQNVHTRKVGEIITFCAAIASRLDVIICCAKFNQNEKQTINEICVIQYWSHFQKPINSSKYR